MEGTIFSRMFSKNMSKGKKSAKVNNLSKARMNDSYIIKEIKTTDGEMRNFLFTLGCYEGEEITVISKLADNFVISVKDARYSIDTDLAKAIVI